MKRKKTLLLVLICITCLSCLSAGVVYSPALETSAGANLSFPLSSYMEPMGKCDPCFAFTSDLMAANIKINDIDFGLGFSFLYNSRSALSERYFLQSYWGIGASAGAQYRFDDLFSLGLKTRYLFCRFGSLKNRFDIIDLELRPGFNLPLAENLETTLTVPVTCSFKNDIFSLRIGAGFDIQYNVRAGGRK